MHPNDSHSVGIFKTRFILNVFADLRLLHQIFTRVNFCNYEQRLTSRRQEAANVETVITVEPQPLMQHLLKRDLLNACD